jgi:hemerythrin-like domain-containing protein
MKITDALLGEHGVLYALFDHVEAALPRAGSLAEVRALADLLGAALLSHARCEEELLFPALEAHIGPNGPLTVMQLEHQEIDEGIEDAAQAAEPAAAVDAIRRVIEIARPHFRKEECVLFALAQARLGDAELEALGAAWASTRRVELSNGSPTCGPGARAMSR